MTRNVPPGHSVIEEIKSRLDIVEIVGETVPLRRSGKNYIGFCPFHHNVRTPAFVVFPDTQTWRCFGACNTGGDVFQFVMKRDGLSFSEALRVLAERAGVPLTPKTPEMEARERGARPPAGGAGGRRPLLPEPAPPAAGGGAGAGVSGRPGVDPGDHRALRPGLQPRGLACPAGLPEGPRLLHGGAPGRRAHRGAGGRNGFRSLPGTPDDPHPGSPGPRDRLRGPRPLRRGAQVSELPPDPPSSTKARCSSPWTWPGRRSGGQGWR
jgi:hypothetical protein